MGIYRKFVVVILILEIILINFFYVFGEKYFINYSLVCCFCIFLCNIINYLVNISFFFKFIFKFIGISICNISRFELFIDDMFFLELMFILV